MKKSNFLNNFKKTAQRMTGFTLPEILVYITVLSIIIFAVSSFLIWAIRSDGKSRAMREVSYNTEKAMNIMGREIKQAKAVYGPTSFFNSHPGQLSLETTQYLIPGEEISYIDFYLCDTRLCFKKQGHDPITLTLDNVEITNLIFEQINSGNICSIKITLEVKYKNPFNRPELMASVDLTSTFSLRFY